MFRSKFKNDKNKLINNFENFNSSNVKISCYY